MISNKLFGDLETHFHETSSTINAHYFEEVSHYVSTMKLHGTKNVDLEINSIPLERLHRDIERNTMIQEGKLGVALASRIGPKALQVISAKIAVKAATKATTKGASKAATKMAAAGSGGALGSVCGPFSPICGALLATTFWFTTDAVIVNGDEYLHRDQFKEEILSTIRRAQQETTREFKTIYTNSFQEIANTTRSEYQKAPIVERKRRRVREKF